MDIARNGSLPSNAGPAEYFTGRVRIDARFQREAPARVGGATVTFNGGQRLAVANPPKALAPYKDKDVVFGTRPEMLRMGKMLTGPVHLVENSGSDTFVTLKVGDKNFIARFPGRVKIDHSAELGVDLDPAQGSWFDPASGQRIV